MKIGVLEVEYHHPSSFLNRPYIWRKIHVSNLILPSLPHYHSGKAIAIYRHPSLQMANIFFSKQMHSWHQPLPSYYFMSFRNLLLSKSRIKIENITLFISITLISCIDILLNTTHNRSKSP